MAALPPADLLLQATVINLTLKTRAWQVLRAQYMHIYFQFIVHSLYIAHLHNHKQCRLLKCTSTFCHWPTPADLHQVEQEIAKLILANAEAETAVWVEFDNSSGARLFCKRWRRRTSRFDGPFSLNQLEIFKFKEIEVVMMSREILAMRGNEFI